MQAQAPEAFEVEKESEATKKLYGLDEEVTRDFGWQCLLARRLAERDVRFIQCTHSYKWDQHSDILEKHPANAKEVDKPIAGLLKDLKARGLLKDTLVIWAGEFGRTPVSQAGAARTKVRARSQSVRLHHLDGRRRREARLHLRRHRRYRLLRGRGSHAHPRFPCDGAAPDGPGPYAADVQLLGPRFSADGCGGRRGAEDCRLAADKFLVSAFLRQAEEILEVASGGAGPREVAIVLGRGGRPADDGSRRAGRWSAMSAEFGAKAVFRVERRGQTLRVEGLSGSERCLLQRRALDSIGRGSDQPRLSRSGESAAGRGSAGAGRERGELAFHFARTAFRDIPGHDRRRTCGAVARNSCRRTDTDTRTSARQLSVAFRAPI